jgi:isocitrate dehydrogenase (NAD+)
MSSRRERHHGSRSGKPGCNDSLRDHDAPTSRVCALLHRGPDTNLSYTSLDHIANKIAAATFEVLNAGRVKTADMGGKSFFDSSSGGLPIPLFQRAGSSTTSEFTAAVIQNLE